MPDGFRMSGSDLHKASQDTSTVRENSKGHISNLRNQLSSLEGAWKGEAATAFHSLYQRFETASDKILTDLQTISESLEGAAKKYGHQETSTTDTFKQAGNGFSF
jgi:WXG100 family type VII secretion target